MGLGYRSLKNKIYTVLLLVFFSALISFVYTLIKSDEVSREAIRIRDVVYPSLVEMQKLRDVLNQTKEFIQQSIEESDTSVFEEEIVGCEKSFKASIADLKMINDSEELLFLNFLYSNYVGLGQSIVEKYIENQKFEDLQVEMGIMASQAKKMFEAIEEFKLKKASDFNSSLTIMNTTFEKFIKYFVFSSLFLFVALCFLATIIYLLVKDINNLSVATKQIASNHFDSTIVSTRKDELGELQTSIDTMRVGMKDLIENLNDKIDDKTEALTKALLASEDATKTKALFLANMSHEIRTPMNGIMGSAKLLMDEKLNSESQDLTEMIYHSTSSLLIIINDILDISKIEAGKLTIEMIAIDLKIVIHDIYTMMQQTVEDKDIDFLVEYPDDAPTYVIGDPTRIRQILLNIISNAVKFTEKGHVKLSVSFEKLEERKYNVVFCIIDTGIGMTTKQANAIFEPFSQADTSTARKFGGTGLGTTISKNLCDLMNGDILVESNVGSGSKFCIHIPMEESLVQHLNVDEAPSSLSRDYGKIILLAEDNNINQKIAKKSLKKLGIDVILAENGLVAVELANDSFDLILMDIQMPIMDGKVAATKIIESGLKIPIVAMTANVFAEQIEEYRAIGMPDCIPKPFKVSELVKVFDKYFGTEG